MITLLSIQTVAPGREREYADIQRKVWSMTHNKEAGMLRYEHFKGQKDRQFYSILVFKDFDAFLAHQVADYHDDVDWMGMFDEHQLQVLDPLGRANALEPTALPAPSPDWTPLERDYAAMIPSSRPAWWDEVES